MAGILNHTSHCVSDALQQAPNVSAALAIELQCVSDTQSALLDVSQGLAPYVQAFGSAEDSAQQFVGATEQEQLAAVQFLVAQQVGFMSEVRRNPRYAPLFTPPPQPCVHGEVLVRTTTVVDARTGELVGESSDVLRFRVNCAEEGEDYEVIVHEEVGMSNGSPSALSRVDDDHHHGPWAHWGCSGRGRHHGIYVMLPLMLLSLVCCCAVRRLRRRQRCARAGYPGCATKSNDSATQPLSPTKETFDYPDRKSVV